MCGIVGGASAWLSDSEKDIVNQLFVSSSLRGIDSSGLVCIASRTDTDAKLLSGVYKNTSDPLSFLSLDPVKSLVYPKEYHVKAIIAHNRAATVGSVVETNAHPFNFPNVVGVHNGTIRTPWHDGPNYETDSEALYWQINTHGTEYVVKKIGRSYQDAYALVFFDYQDKTLNFIRNTLRPLSIAKLTESIFWASEAKMLEWIMFRNTKTAEIIELEPFKLYKYQMAPFDPVPMIMDFTPPLPPPQKTWRYVNSSEQGEGFILHDSNFRRSSVSCRDPERTLLSKQALSVTDNTTDVVVNGVLQDDDYIWDVNNNILPVSEARPIVAKGCVWCYHTDCLEDVTTSDGELEGVFYKDDIGQTLFVCSGCYEEDLLTAIPMFRHVH